MPDSVWNILSRTLDSQIASLGTTGLAVSIAIFLWLIRVSSKLRGEVKRIGWSAVIKNWRSGVKEGLINKLAIVLTNGMMRDHEKSDVETWHATSHRRPYRECPLHKERSFGLLRVSPAVSDAQPACKFDHISRVI